MRFAIAGIVVLTTFAVGEAEACDEYATRKVIGFSADGSVVVSRVSGERPGPGEWIRIETHRLPALVLEKKWDIVTREELELRLAKLKGAEWVPEDDPSIVKLRGKRWRAVEAELTGKGFVIDPNRELPSQESAQNRSFRLEALDAELRQEKASSDPDVECPRDLVLRVGKKTHLVAAKAVVGCSAGGTPWFESAYASRGGDHLILVRRGACADPSMLVFSMKELAAVSRDP